MLSTAMEQLVGMEKSDPRSMRFGEKTAYALGETRK